MTLIEQLLRRKAQAAQQHIAEGGNPEDFPALWARTEHLELAELAGQPDFEKPISSMDIKEKVALREAIGDAEFTTRCVRESRRKQ